MLRRPGTQRPMEKRCGSSGLVACIAAGLLIAACDGQVETSTTDAPQGSSEDLIEDDATAMVEEVVDTVAPAADGGGDQRMNVADLDQAFSAYISCARPILNGYLRVDFERYMGITGEYSLPDGRNDGALMDELDSDCRDSSKLTARVDAFAAEYTPTRSMIEAIAADVHRCLETADLDSATAFEEAAPQTADDLNRAVGAISYPGDPAVGQRVLDCVDTSIYGTKVEF